MQRELEAAGFVTITLSPIPDLTAAVNVPRVAAIEYPLGRTFGEPDDRDGQMAVLQATLQAAMEIDQAGTIVHLPFTWPALPRDVHNSPPESPPIARYLQRHPWELMRLLRRNVPT